jgi:hypothetical protein
MNHQKQEQMRISDRIFDTKTRNLYRNLCSKIANEHFKITLGTDRNFNYLWFMYTKGVHAGETADFIILSEINLLNKLGLLNEEEIENLRKMLISNDNDNIHMALLSVKSLRTQRIKQHGEFTEIDKVSPELAEAALTYAQYITPTTTKVA